VSRIVTTLSCAAMLVIAAHVDAYAQVFTGFPPATVPLSGNEQVPADTGGSPPSVRITSRQLGQYLLGYDPQRNWLIAGDASQNLWQRGTTGAVSSGLVVFGPDRWAYWGTSATAMQVSQDLTSAAVLPGFGAAYRMQRVAGSTGTDMLCMGQEVSSVNSVMLQGQFVSLDFDVLGGADLSASQVGIYIMTGTGVDEGMQKLAFGFNGGGGGSVGWTGQNRVVGALYSPLVVGGMRQPAVVGWMPTNETEVGVLLCMTPTGTAGTYDFLDFSAIQLRMASALAPFASLYSAYEAAALPTPPFVWRPNTLETFLQYAYYWQETENAGTSVVGSSCRVGSANNQADCFMLFPVPLNRVPDMSFVTGFSVDTSTSLTQPCTGLGLTPGISASVTGATIRCTATSNVKAASFLYNGAGAGVIRADAELN
jgi:hypothetical protein